MPHEATREKRSKNLLIAVGLGAFVVRLVYLAQLLNAPFFDLRLGDAEAYHEWALRIAGGDWIGTDAFYQAPLYPYFLAGVYALFGNGAGIVRLVQAAIGAGSCVLLSAAGMALFGRWGATAGVLLAIYPTAIFFDGMMEKTALVGFFTAALLYSAGGAPPQVPRAFHWCRTRAARADARKRGSPRPPCSGVVHLGRAPPAAQGGARARVRLRARARARGSA